MLGRLLQVCYILFYTLPVHGDVLLHDSFDSGEISASWTSWAIIGNRPTAAHYSPSTIYEPFVETPTNSGAMSMHYRTLAGTNEQTPVSVDLESGEWATLFGEADTDEVVIEWNEYFEADYVFATTSQKMARIYYYNESFPESRKDLSVVTQSENIDINFQYACGAPFGDGTNCDIDTIESTSTAHPLDEWVKWDLHVKANTPGVADGFIRLYKNDVMVLERAGDIRGTDTRGFNGMWVGGNYSMSSGTLSAGGSRYIDDVKICDSYPCTPGSPVTVGTMRGKRSRGKKR